MTMKPMKPMKLMKTIKTIKMMKKMKWTSLILAAASLISVAPALHAQGASYTAYRNSRAQVGVGGMYLIPDYTVNAIKGVSVWGDYDFRRFIGAEVSVHLGNLITPSDIAENSYMIGPRAMYHYHRFTGYAKLLLGRATITNQETNKSSSYNAYSFGGGLEYRLLRKLNIRLIDVDIQKWPDFEPNTLSPTAVTVGVSYIVF